MEEEESLGRFSYNTIYSYIKDGTYPEGFSKSDKGSLRKRAKYFFIKEADLYYTSKTTSTGNVMPRAVIYEQKVRIVYLREIGC